MNETRDNSPRNKVLHEKFQSWVCVWGGGGGGGRREGVILGQLISQVPKFSMRGSHPERRGEGKGVFWVSSDL